MSKLYGSAVDETESIVMIGRKGGEANGEAGDQSADDSNAGAGDSGQTETPQSWKVMDREFKSTEEMTAEIERANKEILSIKQQQAEAAKKSATPPSGGESPDEEAQRREVKDRLKNEYGLIDLETAQKIADESAQKNISIQKVIDSVNSFSSKHDGSDGKPKAEFTVMLETMDRHNLTDPQKAYELLHGEALREAYAKELLEKRPKGGRVYSEKSSGATTNPDEKPIRYNDTDARAARKQGIIDRHPNG